MHSCIKLRSPRAVALAPLLVRARGRVCAGLLMKACLSSRTVRT